MARRASPLRTDPMRCELHPWVTQYPKVRCLECVRTEKSGNYYLVQDGTRKINKTTGEWVNICPKHADSKCDSNGRCLECRREEYLEQNPVIPCDKHPGSKVSSRGRCRACTREKLKKARQELKQRTAEWRAANIGKPCPEHPNSKWPFWNVTCPVCGLTRPKPLSPTCPRHPDITLTESRKCFVCDRRNRRKSLYHLTDEQLDELLSMPRCEICGRLFTATGKDKRHIDHDHKTGKVRGVLCVSCNTSLGKLGDSVVRLKSAIRYLRRTGRRTANSAPGQMPLFSSMHSNSTGRPAV